MTPRLSRHIKERWCERFPGATPGDCHAAIARAKAIPYWKAKLLGVQRAHSGSGFLYDAATGAVFVFARDWAIVATVLITPAPATT